MKRASLVLLALALMGAAAPPAPAVDVFTARREGWLRQLGETIRVTIARHDTDNPVFHGNIDWHSSVHAHWALLAIARLTGEEWPRTQVDASLTTAGIQAEDDHLRADPSFEMPYGRAWFLRLAIEDYSNPRLHEMARHVADSLKTYYSAHPPDPSSKEYNNASWALRQMHDYYQRIGDEAGLAFVRTQVEHSFLSGHLEILPDKDAHEWPEFFSRWANWSHLLAKTAGTGEVESWLGAHPADSMEPLTEWTNAHHLGTNLSRAWGLWSLYQSLGDVRFRDASFRHIEEGMKEYDQFKNDYHSYGHWVPQFTVYAIAQTYLTTSPGPAKAR